jgi:hypothetical protein
MAAAPAESSMGTMEALLFRPTTRFRDSHRGSLPYGCFTELELLPGLPIENILAADVTWEEFCRFLQGKLVWMTPGIYVRSWFTSEGPLFLWLGDDGGTGMFVYVRSNTAAEVVTATCDFLVRLLATFEEHAVNISGLGSGVPSPLSGAGLSLFFQESLSCLRHVTFFQMALDADQCHALAAMSRLDVELEIISCSLADDAAGAFVECLRTDRGPVKLIDCIIDDHVLASTLKGNSRVTKLRPRNRARRDDTNMAILFRALANNSGLVELELQQHPISDDNWSIVCESLKAHPTLTNLNLRFTGPRSLTGGRNGLSDEQKAHRSRVVADMMKENTGLHTIQLSEAGRDQQIYTEEIIPYLETNRYRPRVNAIKKTIARPFREKVLGRALCLVKSNPNLVWMFLSQNVDAFVRSEEEDSGVAVSVAAAVVVVAVAVVAGSKRKR